MLLQTLFAKVIFSIYEGIVADILGIVHGGKFLAVEVKSATGRISEAQREFLARVSVLGGVALVVRSVEELRSGLEAAGVV